MNIVSRKFDHIEATQRNETSILSLTLSEEEEHTFECSVGNFLFQIFRVKPIDPNKLASICTVTSPSINVNGVGSMTLSCEVNSGELDVSLTLEGIGLNVSDDSPGSSQRKKDKTLYFDDFNNVLNASCKAFIQDIDITRSCTYPNIIKAQYIVKGNDIIVECDDESEVNHWRFYGSDGIKEDIKNRSWSRKGGRLLLIQDISERDFGKMVVCRTKGDDNQTNKGTVGVTVFLRISGDNKNSNLKDPAPTLSAHNVYLFLTILFLVLWLITNAVCGVWLGYRSGSTHEVSTIPRTSDNEQTQTTPEYATVFISMSGRNHLDTEESTINHLLLTMSFMHSGLLQPIMMILNLLHYLVYLLLHFCNLFHFLKFPRE